MSIIFYDIPSTSPGYSVSPNTWKTRYCLNLKGLSYVVEWVEFPHIASLYEKLHVTPAAKKPDGNPHYTLPMIFDPATDKYIPDSLAIAQYLDQQYPDSPRIFPNDSADLLQNFSNTAMSYMPPARHLITWNIFIKLNPPSAVYYRRIREVALGRKMEELIPGDQIAAEMNAFKEILGKIDTLYTAHGEKGPYLMGDVIS